MIFRNDDPSLLACTASAWEGDESRCRWCNAELTGRRTRWCSNACANDFGRNHWWTAASRGAHRRDGTCVDCRCDPREAHERALADGLTPHLAGRFLVLQVHHKTPILGRHAEGGCHHHLDGLELVCLHHHLARHHGPQEHQLGLAVA